jgi:hypothetical protein
MSFNWRKTLLSLSAASVVFAALQSGVMSGQILSSSGSDFSTRFLLRATDSSIALWSLNADNVNLGYNHYYGPYFGYEPMGIATGADNWTRVLWKHTDGSIVIWILDPALNYITGKVFGPEPGWNPITLSANPNGNLSVLWKATTGELALWRINTKVNNTGFVGDWTITDTHFGPFPAFDVGAKATAPTAGAAQSAKALGDILHPVAETNRD